MLITRWCKAQTIITRPLLTQFSVQHQHSLKPHCHNTIHNEMDDTVTVLEIWWRRWSWEQDKKCIKHIFFNEEGKLFNRTTWFLLHFLALLAVPQHWIPHLSQNCRFHLILDDESFLCRVDIQATALHFPVKYMIVTVHNNVIKVKMGGKLKKQTQIQDTGKQKR